ncbi:MAG TPA: sigma-70 family RNA polymerase sigma factor [Ohtaekwangia sp.]|nr:sigma-70 family RNA polymerase sigma factor [Ohtaekwangia sp.]
MQTGIPHEQLEPLRKYLFTVAYNILGEVEEAKDVVHDAYAYFLSLEEGHVKNVKSYLTRVVANKAIDKLNDLKKKRENYPGTWLPEPYVHNPFQDDPFEAGIMNYDVLSRLEILNPVERAVFVLREGFDFPFSELAILCNATEINCRKILSRAREKVKMNKALFNNNNKNEKLLRLIEVFLKSVDEENLKKLTDILREDIILYSDSGGKVPAAINPIFGYVNVAKFMIGIARKYKSQDVQISIIQVNGQEAVLISLHTLPETLIIFSEEGGKLQQIQVIRNPDKLLLKNLSQKQRS